MYDIPDSIFEQYNHAQVSTMMGLFAELNHAWITIDNTLYLWDYTHPNPELVGFEEQPNSITAVKLLVPRPGVFVAAVTHVLVVATTAEILILGVSAGSGPSGVINVSLYQTRMALPTKGIDVHVIEGSKATGRIFFAGRGDNEVYELTYQQEEKWFASRCAKVNHTSPGYASLVPSKLWGTKSPEHVVDMVVDDSRNLLYTLSSESSIRTFYMDTPTSLQLVIEKRRQECLRDISHMVSPTPLLTDALAIVSINCISANEASKLHLMATTSTGCRLFLSATRGYGYTGAQGAPQSMQVQHIKFPPPSQQDPRASSSGQIAPYQNGAAPAIDTQSQSLVYSRLGLRFPPGYFFCFVSRNSQPGTDVLFLSSPDTARIAAPTQDQPGQPPKYHEQGLWLGLESRAEAVGLVTRPFAAASEPKGFGNELAVQYDEPAAEIAILTNTGIHTIRKRRLVDVFAASIRRHGDHEGLETEIKRFIRQYGRGETTATALAVACGQGMDVSGDSRMAKITDPDVLDAARRAFVEYGGRPSLNENAIVDGSTQAIDNIRPSSRHEGMALYMSRLVRSIWKAPVIRQSLSPSGGLMTMSTASIPRLQAIQQDLQKLQDFLNTNKTFIEGLAGPELLSKASSKQEETALQGEHQALHSLVLLTTDIIEGISFVMMLFDERVDEIWISLDDTSRQRLRELTFEKLFTTNEGKDLAKVLVKSIVNRNIANGSNVDTVAEALRRRCGSFCSADDVIIFKAQEQLKKASEVGGNTDYGRQLLNESLRLFQQVAGSLSYEHLELSVVEFESLQYYAGAISLALNVAKESDRGNRALTWIADGKPELDARAPLFERRKRCYNLVHHTLQSVDQASSQAPEFIDGRLTTIAKKRNEAYNVINESQDEVFQNDLYDWYLSQSWEDRLLEVNSPYVVPYLQRISSTSVANASLLWKFYASREQYFDAATVLLQLAKSDFQLSLEKRIEYLSRAKANASTTESGVSRQARQVMQHEVSELLDVASIQADILSRLSNDSRVPDERRAEVIERLDGPVISLTDVRAYCQLNIKDLPLTNSSSTTSTLTKQATTISACKSTRQPTTAAQQISNPPGAV